MRTDYYQLLDVKEDASAAEIKAAYRKLAMKFHPDHNDGRPEAEERFKQIAEAYRVLGEEERRRDYDDWLCRQKRYRGAPELVSMPRHVRVSVRHARERREERRSRTHRGTSTRVRPFLLRRVPRLTVWHYLLFYLFWALLFLPPLFSLRREAPSQKPPPRVPPDRAPGESPLDPETQRLHLARFTERIARAAQDGSPEAQFRYGTMLIIGAGGLERNPESGYQWWQKAADQGFAPAQKALRVPKPSEPPQSESVESSS